MSDLQGITRLMEELSLSLKRYAYAEAAMEELASDMHLSADLLQSILRSSSYGASELNSSDRGADGANSQGEGSAIELQMKLQQLSQKRQENMNLLRSIVDIVRLARNGVLYTNAEWPAAQARIEAEYQDKIDIERSRYANIEQQIRNVKLNLDKRRKLADKMLNM